MSEAVMGKIWWIADNEAEAMEWVRAARGTDAVFTIYPPRENGERDVVIELNRCDAVKALGYEPDEDEWLEEEDAA